MTPSQVDQVLGMIAKTFSRNKLPQNDIQIFGDRVAGIDITMEQAEAVIEQHRTEHDYASPKLSVLLKAMTAAQQAKRIQTARRSTGNKIVDRYRLHYGTSDMTDVDVAMRVARMMEQGVIKIKSHDGSPDQPYSKHQIREHLIDVMSEFVDKEVAQDEAYRVYPDDATYEKILARRWRVKDILKRHDDSSGKLKISDLLKLVVKEAKPKTTKMNGVR